MKENIIAEGAKKSNRVNDVLAWKMALKVHDVLALLGQRCPGTHHLGIKNTLEANEFLMTYLPKYNRRFKKEAASEANLHRSAPHSRELDRILCIKEERTVKNDFTISHNSTLYQIEQATRANKVMVEERLDGTLHITYKGQDLGYRIITTKPAKVTTESPLLQQERKAWIPPADHPWRKNPKPKRRNREQPITVP